MNMSSEVLTSVAFLPEPIMNVLLADGNTCKGKAPTEINPAQSGVVLVVSRPGPDNNTPRNFSGSPARAPVR